MIKREMREVFIDMETNEAHHTKGAAIKAAMERHVARMIFAEEFSSQLTEALIDQIAKWIVQNHGQLVARLDEISRDIK